MKISQIKTNLDVWPGDSEERVKYLTLLFKKFSPVSVNEYKEMTVRMGVSGASAEEFIAEANKKIKMFIDMETSQLGEAVRTVFDLPALDIEEDLE
jgi:hypothetical protein